MKVEHELQVDRSIQRSVCFQQFRHEPARRQYGRSTLLYLHLMSRGSFSYALGRISDLGIHVDYYGADDTSWQYLVGLSRLSLSGSFSHIQLSRLPALDYLDHTSPASRHACYGGLQSDITLSA